MILSKQKILEAISAGLIGIDPFDPSLLKEASYSFRFVETSQIPAQGFVVAETRKILIENATAGILSVKQ